MSTDSFVSGAPPLPWHRVRELGRGTYGVVYLAESIKTNSDDIHNQFAVKTAPLKDAWSLIKENQLYEVFEDCPEIVQCLFDQITFEQGGLRRYNLLLEYASGGTLEDVIKRERGGLGLFENDVRNYTRMILKGLHCMHQKGYVHCDLKPSNILAFPYRLIDSSNDRTVYKLKLADFGLVKEPNEELQREDWVGVFRGAPYYMSPESVGMGIICTKLDIWSLGCVVVQMLFGQETPWPNYHHLSVKEFMDLLVGKCFMKPRIPPFMSDVGKDFLSKCFERDPRKRFSAESLLLHPYVNEF